MITIAKKRIPKEFIDELDVTKRKAKKLQEVTITVEKHQAKIPLPKNIRIKLKLEKGAKCTLEYDEENKELKCKF